MSAFDRFMSSTVMDFEKWHDGTGYDLEAIDEMTDAEKAIVVTALAANLKDWRDLEALERIGTPAALAAILTARDSYEESVRLAAHQYGPASDPGSREAAIVASLERLPGFGNLSTTLDQAVEHPTSKVVQALLRLARDAGGPAGYGAAAALYAIKGRIDSHNSMEKRAFFLRVSSDDLEERSAAFETLCSELGLAVRRVDQGPS